MTRYEFEQLLKVLEEIRDAIRGGREVGPRDTSSTDFRDWAGESQQERFGFK